MWEKEGLCNCVAICPEFGSTCQALMVKSPCVLNITEALQFAPVLPPTWGRSVEARDREDPAHGPAQDPGGPQLL